MTRVASFLGPGERFRLRPSEWLDARLDGTGDAFAFALGLQQERNWCWAAVGQAVEYALRGAGPSQQAVATHHLGLHNPGASCAPPGANGDNGGRCDDDGCHAACGSNHAVHVVLRERGLLAGTIRTDEPVRLADVQAETAMRHPVVLRMEGGATGHFICIAGWWVGPNRIPQVLVHDPRVGARGRAKPGYLPLATVADRYPMGAVYARNTHAYATH